MSAYVEPALSPADALHLVAEDLERIAEESSGALTRSMITEALLDHEALLWLILDDAEKYAGCVVTEWVDEPGGAFVHIVGMRVRPGSNGTFGSVIDRLSKWAHDAGARLSGTSCRRGMGRHLAKLGWEPRFVEYVEPA